MSRLDLRHTHRLVFRQIIATVVFTTIVGFGMTFFPDQFFSASSYWQIIGRIAPPQIWGASFLVVSAMIVVGIATNASYRVSQFGLILFSTICIVWSIGIFLGPVASTNTAYTGAFIWGLIGFRTFFLALEPPVNPITAITVDKNEDNG